MNKYTLLYIILVLVLIIVAIPIIHLLRTYLQEVPTKTQPPHGYINDASGLNKTPIDTLIQVPDSQEAIVSQLKEIIAYAKAKKIPISIAGAKHTMGGHTMYPHGIVVNMLPYKSMQIDTTTNILTVGAGALWQDIISYIDQFDRSVAIMQAFSSFSVGGSISVNGHGWQKDMPPISASVLSFTLLNHNGELLSCSRTQNAELFRLVIGGYGLFGIILDIQLQLVKNESLQYNYIELKPENYVKEYNKIVSGNPKVQLAFGRLRVSNKKFLEEATLNFFEIIEQKPLPLSESASNNNDTKRLVFRSSVQSEYGKRLRWDLEATMNSLIKKSVFSRNYILNDPVSLIENKDTTSTDILQEYFIPERNFTAFIHELKNVLPAQNIDLLNITIRAVHKDEDSFLPYAKENVFGFVLLFNQKKNQEHENAMQSLTKKLVAITMKYNGTYYLPYRLHIDKETFRAVYPQADMFFERKLYYDPQEIFRNKFYEHYK